MTGERDLSKLLAGLHPELSDEIYVFVSVPEKTDITSLNPLLQYREEEGVTLILTQDEADQNNLPSVFPCRRITLKVHSALDASGLIAAVSAELAKKNIPMNPVAGYYHDHLFVPEAVAEDAMATLRIFMT